MGADFETWRSWASIACDLVFIALMITIARSSKVWRFPMRPCGDTGEHLWQPVGHLRVSDGTDYRLLHCKGCRRELAIVADQWDVGL